MKISLLLSLILISSLLLSGCVDNQTTSDSDNKNVDNSKSNNTELTPDDITIEEIFSDSDQSPIRKYFTTKKILWTFDDYRIELNHHPPHKGFGGLSQQIANYGGHVNIMTVFTRESFTKPYNNKIKNYSVINDFGWNQNKIDKSIEFFNQPNIYPQCHGWNHSADLNNANLSFAYEIMNYSLWNWQNNFNIKPNFFLGHSTSGNYNITKALQDFSKNYWPVYGENFRWNEKNKFPIGSRDAPAIEYICKPQYIGYFDPLFGCDWSNPCETLQEAQELFNTSYYDDNKEIIFIRGHPSFLNDTNQMENLILWQDWIDWIYKEHKLINLNHTEIIHYNMDRYNFKIRRNDENNYTIDLTNCIYDHNILFTNPHNDITSWILYSENWEYIDEIINDSFIKLESGKEYYFIG
jgi:hypothetical protein